MAKHLEPNLYKCCHCPDIRKCRHAWHANYRGERIGLRRWATKAPRSVTEARVVLQALKQAVDLGTFSRLGEGIRVSETIPLRDFMVVHGEDEKKRRLRGNYSAYVALLVREWGDEPLISLARRPHVIEQRLHEIANERKWSPTTFNRARSYGYGVFSRAERWGFIAQNPFKRIKTMRENGYRRRRISPEQEQKILDALIVLGQPFTKKLTCEQADQIRQMRHAGRTQAEIARQFGVSVPTVADVLNNERWSPDRKRRWESSRIMTGRFFAALDTGLRRREMQNVQLRDIDFDNWWIHIRAENTKSNRDQRVPVETQRLRAFLLQRRRELQPQGYVFGTERGDRIKSFDGLWRRLFRRAGLPIGRQGYVWHDLRHEFGSHVMDSGGTIYEAQEMLRHSNITTTQRYLATSEKRLRQLAASFANRTRNGNEGEGSGSPGAAA